jgi:hypothetical protein
VKPETIYWVDESTESFDIQPVPFGIDDLSDTHNPFVAVIKNTGIAITQNVIEAH